MTLINISIIIYSVIAIVQSKIADPLVFTKTGSIRGLHLDYYDMFRGIPYATVPKNNHFGPSVPYPPWNFMFFAHEDIAFCPQIDDKNNPNGYIDCLYLNVYVPDSVSLSKKAAPVMVFINGGQFVSNNDRFTNFGPKFFMKHDIIVVVINYRVGVYGFMCLDDPRVPGNQGLKDQLIALRWVKDNIEIFNGDVNNITLCGQDAGAVSVDLHTLIDNEALFDKAIIQSGTSLSPWVMKEPDRNAPFKIAEALGFQGGNLEETLSFLSSKRNVVGTVKELGLEFGPCVEKNFEDVEIFIETNPINMKVGKTKNIPVLIGTNDNKLFDLYEGVDIKNAAEIFRDRLKNNFVFDDEKLNATVNIVRHFYIGDEELTDAVRTDIINFDADFLFQHPTQRSIDNYLDTGRTVFYYMFSYVGKRNFLKKHFGLTGAANYADELAYLFDVDLFPEQQDEADHLMIERMTTLWTNFVKFGDPTPEKSELFPKWTPVTNSRMNYLSLDSEVQMKSRPLKEHMAFWDLFYDAYAKMQKGYAQKNL